MKQGLIFMCAALTLIALPGASQAARHHLGMQDRNFLAMAAQGGATEVQLGQLAVSKHDGRQVQQFAQRMIQDHSAANNKLMSIAANKDIKLPSDPRVGMGASGRAVYDRLNGMSGSQFARAYMTQMVSDHQKTEALLRREIRYGKDPDLRAFARVTLPTVQNHLAMAGDLSAMVNGGSSRMYAHRRMHM